MGEKGPKVRVHELARELRVATTDLLAWLNDDGEFVKSASTTLEPPVVRKVVAAKASGALRDGPGSQVPMQHLAPRDIVRFYGLSRGSVEAWLRDRNIDVDNPGTLVARATVEALVRELVADMRGRPEPNRGAHDAAQGRAQLPASEQRASFHRRRVAQLASDLHLTPSEMLQWLQKQGEPARSPHSWVESPLVRLAFKAKSEGRLGLRPSKAILAGSVQPVIRSAPTGPSLAPGLASESQPSPAVRSPEQSGAPEKPAHVIEPEPATTRVQVTTSTDKPVRPAATLEPQALGPSVWRAATQPLHPADPLQLGDYVLMSRLGHGGMGTVYQARREGTATDVALKALSIDLLTDDKARSRFERESDVLKAVDPAFTARVLDVGADGPRPFLVMEMLDGITLSKAISLAGPLRGELLVAVACGLAAALVAVHDAGLVHRDVKPGNVILTPAGLKLIDFGIARLTAPQTGGLTTTGVALGTYEYMAPENFVSPQAVGPLADVFSWAGTVLFAATGAQPFPGTHYDLIRVIMDSEPPGLFQMDQNPLREVLLDAFKKDPRARPTASQLLKALGAPDARELRGAVKGAMSFLLTS